MSSKGWAISLDHWQRSGQEKHAAGEGEYNAALAKGYTERICDASKGEDSLIGEIGRKRLLVSPDRVQMIVVPH